MDKFTIKELNEMPIEQLIAAFHNNAVHMAKEQSFPKWRQDYERKIINILSVRLGFNPDKLIEHMF
ncbi:hypothetical protein M3_0027 [Lysinibacillus phage vB_LfM_LysYB1]|nr:hypothetical protein M3_0027 [Lysinibacillus phage vB_LfM_LysYB1]WAB25230.1 hypothetical protein M5_0052 [Lysinibacillus phage vB_LfM_LysYB2]